MRGLGWAPPKKEHECSERVQVSHFFVKEFQDFFFKISNFVGISGAYALECIHVFCCFACALLCCVGTIELVLFTYRNENTHNNTGLNE